MSYLIDTNVISEVLRKRPDPRVVEWLQNAEENSQFLSAISMGEIQKGIIRLPASTRRKDLEQWFQNLKTRYAARLLSFTEITASHWAQLRFELEKVGRVMPVLDSLIAATALEHDLAIVTRNASDFNSTGAVVINPWNI